MDEGIGTILYYLIPIIITVFCIFLTVKVSFSKRFLPNILLIILAAALFFVGQFVRQSNNQYTNFEFGLTFSYLGITLVLGGVISVIPVAFRKR